MATYLDKLNNNPIIVEKNNNQQRVDATAEYINSGLSIFGMLLQSRVDGKGGDDEISEKTQAKIDDYQTKIDEKLKEANATTIEELSSKITASQDAQTRIQGEINACDKNLSSIQGQIKELNVQLTNADSDELKNKIKGQLQELEKQESAAVKAKGDKVKALEKAKREEAVLLAQKAEIENLQHNIDKLKKQLPKEVNYNVKKETDDLASFSDAMKAFRDDPNEKTAAALTKVYYGGHKGVQNKTAQTAYDFIVKQYPQLFSKTSK